MEWINRFTNYTVKYKSNEDTITFRNVLKDITHYIIPTDADMVSYNIMNILKMIVESDKLVYLNIDKTK